jgi:hypothetical protein
MGRLWAAAASDRALLILPRPDWPSIAAVIPLLEVAGADVGRRQHGLLKANISFA